MEQKAMLPPSGIQVAAVVENLDETIKFYSSVLNIRHFRVTEFNMPTLVYKGRPCPLKLKMGFGRFRNLDVELIEAPPGDNVYREFIDAKGEGLHHIGYYVDDFDAEIAKYQKQGIGILQSADMEKVRFAYMDIKKAGGVVFEVIHRKSGLPGT